MIKHELMCFCSWFLCNILHILYMQWPSNLEVKTDHSLCQSITPISFLTNMLDACCLNGAICWSVLIARPKSQPEWKCFHTGHLIFVCETINTAQKYYYHYNILTDHFNEIDVQCFMLLFNMGNISLMQVALDGTLFKASLVFRQTGCQLGRPHHPSCIVASCRKDWCIISSSCSTCNKRRSISSQHRFSHHFSLCLHVCVCENGRGEILVQLMRNISLMFNAWCTVTLGLVGHLAHVIFYAVDHDVCVLWLIAGVEPELAVLSHQ